MKKRQELRDAELRNFNEEMNRIGLRQENEIFKTYNYIDSISAAFHIISTVFRHRRRSRKTEVVFDRNR